MLEIISPRHKVTEISYEYFFHLKGDPDRYCGYSFDCDKEGNLNPLTKAQQESYDYCIANPDKYDKPQVMTARHSYMENAKAICLCGKQIELFNEYLGACQCPYCGSWFNMFGQAVNDPDTWEEGDDW